MPVTTSSTFDRADRVQRVGTTPYTVDAVGNVTARGLDTFGYDQANRLTSATINGSTSTYAYDGDGLRSSSTVGGTTSTSLPRLTALRTRPTP
ncbi:MAG: hypothetical protein HYX52_09815 [Chloroflexi bacterium]|nr:hypothetical protein [Chloroflexota bacterium]